MAALIRWTNGGFSPQAKHGGSGVLALATAGSKLEGTGLEKEHIGHIHVAAVVGGGGGAGRSGLPRRGGVDVGLKVGEGAAPRKERLGRLFGLGYRVILGEDFRKPACMMLISLAVTRLRQPYIEFRSLDIF